MSTEMGQVFESQSANGQGPGRLPHTHAAPRAHNTRCVASCGGRSRRDGDATADHPSSLMRSRVGKGLRLDVLQGENLATTISKNLDLKHLNT